MTSERSGRARPADRRPSSSSSQTTGEQASRPPATGTGSAHPSLPPATDRPPCDSGCVDVTGIAPDNIRVDPDITEGHPGYAESGDSEIIPPGRSSGEKTGGKEKPG